MADEYCKYLDDECPGEAVLECPKFSPTHSRQIQCYQCAERSLVEEKARLGDTIQKTVKEQ